MVFTKYRILILRGSEHKQSKRELNVNDAELSAPRNLSGVMPTI